MKPSPYPALPANPDFPSIEREVLAFWQDARVFEASIEQRPERIGEHSNAYVFYDGPPFANGLPHYGHLLTGYVKDVFARYHTMLGKRVERRFGWDCHGLPAEMAAEKELGLSGRQAILDYGIGEFNDYCRANVMRYADAWRQYVERQGRWVDMRNDYKTMDRDYMESVLWAFKQFYDKGLIYEAFRVLPYSWGAETPLSSFETRLDNATRVKVDKAVTVAFELNERPKGAPEAEKYYVLAWTTTPWTLPSNLALAISLKMRYGYVIKNNICYVLSAAVGTVINYTKELGNEDGVISFHSFFEDERLVGLTYKPLFPYFTNHPNAFRILDGSDFIEEGSGTGIVHMAPGFGEDDQRVCEANGISVVCPVDGKGCYTEEIYDLPQGEGSSQTLRLHGLNVIAETGQKRDDEPYTDAQLEKYGLANLRITAWLKERGVLIRQEDYAHNYPFCWRTDTPLIYRAMPSTYIRVTAFRDHAAQLNEKIDWTPSHVRYGAMGHMLKTAPDWSLSRNRFWGCPIPIWKSDNPNNTQLYVFGSIQELEDFFGPHMTSSPSQGEDRGGGTASPIAQAERADSSYPHPTSPSKGEGKFRITDLHRPFIDELTAPDPTDSAFTLRRVEDVMDCWFESGSMPFAQLHYPFENKEKFEQNFPADFITEYIAQTRGWFNSLIMIGTAVFDSEPFENCICHGVVIDEDGEKLSKRKGNYPDPLAVFDQFGADALRWFMMSSPIMRGAELQIDREGAFIRDAVRLYIKPLWNAYYFFTLYANADGIEAEFKTDSPNPMDRYILAKLQGALTAVKSALDGYDTPGACQAISGFLEILTNWYIRRNRARFWAAVPGDDKRSAYDTLYTVLHALCRAAAPLLPMVTEKIFAGLTQGGTLAKDGSVHLQMFPEELFGIDLGAETILADMDRVRDICNAALAIRNAENIRVRQPLHRLSVYGNGAGAWFEQNNDYYRSIVQDEVNVKTVAILDGFQEVATQKLKINFPVAGKRLGAKMKAVGAAAKSGDWRRDGQTVMVGGEPMQSEEYELLLEAKNPTGTQALSYADGLVVLDLDITPDLIAEGLARDAVRLIQQSRKEADFLVSDRIRLIIDADADIRKALEEPMNRDYIAAQTLAEITFGDAGHDGFIARGEIDGRPVALSLTRAA